MDILNDLVLVLNKKFLPLCTVDVRKAFQLITTQKAVIVDNCWISYSLEEWSSAKFYMLDRAVRTTSKLYIAPEIIKVVSRDEVYSKNLNLTRQNVFLRDDYSCQYCGSGKDLTLDHVIPISRASEFKLEKVNSWTNLVACCSPCNARKDNRTPEEIGFILKKQPVVPTDLLKFKVKYKESWKHYLKQRGFVIP